MVPSNTRPHVSDHPRVPVDSLTSRQVYLERLRNQYERARAGQAGVVMVVGEPGSGKTHLVTQFATWAAQEGATILQGHAWGTEGMPSYLPLLEAVGQYMRTAPADQLRDHAALDPEVLISMFPELAARLGTAPTSNAMSPEQQRWRFYKALGSFLEAVSVAHPLLLLLEDMHQADAESLSLLCYIARHHPQARVLILGTVREGELQQNPAFVHTLAELTRYRMLTMLNVQLLSLLDVEAFALVYLGKPADPAVKVLLYAKSEGNPFFVEELLHSWIETQIIVQESGQWILTASSDDLWPAGIINTLRQRLAQLHPETIEHLRMAAIIGPVFDVSLLSAIETQEVETVENCLLEAARACLIESDQAGGFRFNQRALYECLYNDVTPSRRRRVHGCVAHLLEARCGAEQPSSKQLAELAYHFARSDDRLHATLYAQRASALALREYISQEFEMLVKASLQSSPEKKGVQAALPGANRSVALISDLQTAANLAEGLGLVEWWQEMLLAIQALLERVQTLEEKCLSPADMRLFIEQAMPLVAHIGLQPEGQVYAQQLLELARWQAERQAVPSHQSQVNEKCLLPLPV